MERSLPASTNTKAIHLLLRFKKVVEMYARELIDREVVGQQGKLIGKVKDVILDPSSWQIKDIEIQLDSNVAKDYNMKHTFGKTVISLKTSYIQGVGDKIIVRYTSDELGRLIASAATS